MLINYMIHMWFVVVNNSQALFKMLQLVEEMRYWNESKKTKCLGYMHGCNKQSVNKIIYLSFFTGYFEVMTKKTF